VVPVLVPTELLPLAPLLEAPSPLLVVPPMLLGLVLLPMDELGVEPKLLEVLLKPP
jgi:hypothetical protein